MTSARVWVSDTADDRELSAIPKRLQPRQGGMETEAISERDGLGSGVGKRAPTLNVGTGIERDDGVQPVVSSVQSHHHEDARRRRYPDGGGSRQRDRGCSASRRRGRGARGCEGGSCLLGGGTMNRHLAGCEDRSCTDGAKELAARQVRRQLRRIIRTHSSCLLIRPDGEFVRTGVAAVNHADLSSERIRGSSRPARERTADQSLP